MDAILVRGGGPLKGSIPIAGAKNASLALMPATLLSEEPLTLTNAPRLSDIRTMTELLGSLGSEVTTLQEGQVLALSSHGAINTHADIKPRDLQLSRCLRAIEWDSACQDELALLHRHHEQPRTPKPVGHPHEPCRFGDLADLFDDAVQEVLPELYQRPEIALDALLPVIRRGHGIRLSAPCLTHGGKYCTLTCAKRHIAGTSCTSHSRQGAGAKQYDETIIFFAAWAGLRRRLAEPCII